MKKVFYSIMASQFFSSVGDNALLIAAIALLNERSAPDFFIPILKLFFVFSYVLLAAFVGAFADAYPKGQVMFLTNSIKIIGCTAMLYGMNPLIAYAIVGAAAAAYSPAKYGILTELLPPERLVIANGWMEGTTVSSIVLGTMLGGALVNPIIAQKIIALNIPNINQPGKAAIAIISLTYIIAAIFNLKIPNTGVNYAKQNTNPIKLFKNFIKANQLLWSDKTGQISLAITSLLWGAGATLQLIVLKWAEISLGLTLSEATILQTVFAVGLAIGAVLASNFIHLKQSLKVLPVGLIMPILVACMGCIHKNSFDQTWTAHLYGLEIPFFIFLAVFSLIGIGVVAGFFIVPMNALLQHRGYILLSAGHSIAVQNFNENLSILSMLGLYAILIKYKITASHIIFLFSLFIGTAVLAVIFKDKKNRSLN